jgi:hypothetical protein
MCMFMLCGAALRWSAVPAAFDQKNAVDVHKKPGELPPGFASKNDDGMMRLALLEGLNLLVGAHCDDVFAHELVGVFDGGGEGEFDVFAVSGDDDGLGVSVNGLELAFGFFGLAATSEGRGSEGDDSEGGEDGFHVFGIIVVSVSLPGWQTQILGFASIETNETPIA